jgi:hypothetical protein
MAIASFKMPSDFERWTPPASWDPEREAFADDENEDLDVVSPTDSDERDKEPILKAVSDWQLLTIQTAAGGRAAAPFVDPETLLSLARRTDARLVQGERDLLNVILESLGRLQRRLKGRDPIVRALWDEKQTITPKDENFLSDFIVDHFRQDLVRGAIVADREVQLRPRVHGTAGQRTDIQVRAFTHRWTPGGRRSVASLTIEVKGCWNADLYTAMETQLVDRYLASTGESVGLYLVGWYVSPQWKAQKVANVRPPAGTTMESVRASLEAQAVHLSSDGRRLEAFMIDATLA